MSTVSHDIRKLFYNNVVVSGGTGTQALPDGMAHEILQVIVIPPGDGAEYKFYIQENVDNLRVFERTDTITGTYNEMMNPFPVWGNHTFVLYGATNGTYKMRIVLR